MNEDTMEKETPIKTDEVVTPKEGEDVEPKPDVTKPESSKELQSALAQKEHFRQKAEKAEADVKALEDKLNKHVQTGDKKSLDVEDYIDISASLEGLDQREKEYLAKQHKLTGKPLSEIRKDEDFVLWDSAYKAKLEKDVTLKPSGTQTETDKPKTLSEQLAGASLADKEKLLTEQGLYKQPRPRTDRADIGVRK